MSVTNSLSDAYKNALETYEGLNRKRKLKDEELALLKKNASIGDVLQAIKDAKVKNESGRSTATNLIHKITPAYIEKLDRFSKVIEIAIQSHPEIAALAWSGVKFVILISQDIFRTYEKICTILEKISLCVERFSHILSLYGRTNLLDSRVVTFYCDIIEFCLETTKFYARSKLRKLAASILGPLCKPFDELSQKIDAHTQEVEQAAHIEHMTMTRNIGLRVQSQGAMGGTPAAGPHQKIVFMPNILHPRFTGRVGQLEEIGQFLDNARSSGSTKRVAIYGMPGAGKTQLALRYATKNTTLYPNIFHFQATAREQLIQDYQSLCGLLGLRRAASNEPELEIEQVKGWLVNNSDWLIIFDNVLEIATVHDFIPAVSSGSIIFTMRDRNIARYLGSAGMLELLPMGDDDGIDLILNIMGQHTPCVDSGLRKLAAELNREFGGLPLALEQGTSYAMDRDWTLERYLDQLRKQKLETLKLKGTSSSDFHSSFMLTIQGITPEAIILLKIISYLDHQNLHLNLFSEAAKTKKMADFLAEKVVVINPQAEFTAYLKRLLLDPDLKELEQAIACLQTCALLRRKGAVTTLRHAEAQDIPFLETVNAVDVLVGYYDKRHRFNESLPWYERALAGREKSLGKDHPDTLTTVHSMASVFYNQGEYGKALEWYERALAGCEKSLGKDHPDTLSTVYSMASVFYNQGEYGKALEWYERALAGEEKSLGKDHPDTLSTVHSMASVFYNQGEYGKALEWYERALAGEEKSLGKDHPDTLSTVHSMASVFSRQGEYGKALEWHERALAGEEKSLGKDHPDTLSTVHSMALVFSRQGEYGKALEWYERALAGREKSLGKDHPDTLSTVHSMASVFESQGEYGKALEWYERALAGEEKSLGKDHPSTLSTVHSMASVFESQGEYGKALEWYERALAGEEKSLGKDHPSTLSTVHSMASVFESQGEYGKALEWYERALAGEEKSLGKDHPSTLSTVHSMASVFSNQGEYGKALEWYERALAGEEKSLGKDHPSTLSTVHNMASVFYNQGEYGKALEWYERALAGEEKSLGKDHPSTLSTVHNMASVFERQGEYGKALEWYERALAGREKSLGKDHPSTLSSSQSVKILRKILVPELP
ncbi:uncharacterized protein LAJ45_03111 [Morchella importuna]|uniref:uncharacterized protein n=1 Tax=Morchella importuna TaxID=1174673 RepID=UPI001E8DD4A4|nr:uncharacterized protein LAJ45_03111 [Morchella importuna]KAH8152885.1 hypothetical protein LAJ45_03111 [Morchella importuna]